MFTLPIRQSDHTLLVTTAAKVGGNAQRLAHLLLDNGIGRVCFAPKADMDRRLSRVCLVPEADIRSMLACYPLRRHDCSWALRERT
jgi:hypothetical protein